MSVKVSYELVSGDLNAATHSAPMIQGASSWSTHILMLRVGKLYPVVLKRDNFRALDGSYGRNAFIRGDLDTAVSSEATGWTGDGATVVFTAQSLNNTPILPFSVDIYYINAADVTKHVYDKFGNGILYGELTSSTYSGEVAMGTVNYLTGAITLSLTDNATWIPKNAAGISANYTYCTAQVGSDTSAGHKRIYPYTAGSYSQLLDFRYVASVAGTIGQVEVALDLK